MFPKQLVEACLADKRIVQKNLAHQTLPRQPASSHHQGTATTFEWSHLSWLPAWTRTPRPVSG